MAYRYFSTARRKFIIADTPGHEQYTRNMATGASTANAAVVLIDARKGVLAQSRRHAYIASLLGVRSVVVAVNKMDLVDYDEAVFRAIEREFSEVLARTGADTGNVSQADFIPVSALAGDNVVHRSAAMPWYRGPALLEQLETLPAAADLRDAPLRFPVQRVLRPSLDFRGFAGQIASGTVRAGQKITVLPSGRSAEVARIVTFDGDLEEASAPLSVTLVLNEELDIGRGNLLVAGGDPAALAEDFRGTLVWMDQRPLDPARRYLLKHTSQTVPVRFAALESRKVIETFQYEPAETLEMNTIGTARLHLLRPIALDRYARNRSTGAFILIDPETNTTAAAGMVTAIFDRVPGTVGSAEGPVNADERAARWGHRGGVLALAGPEEMADHLERALFDRGMVTVRTSDRAQFAALVRAGILVLHVVQPDPTSPLPTAARKERASGTPDRAGDGAPRVLVASVDGHERTLNAGDPARAAAEVLQLLAEAGVTRQGEAP